VDVMQDFGGSRYERVNGVRQISSAPWRLEIFSLLLGLTLGICVGIMASNLNIAEGGGESSAEIQLVGEVNQNESVKFEFYDVLKNR